MNNTWLWMHTCLIGIKLIIHCARLKITICQFPSEARSPNSTPAWSSAIRFACRTKWEVNLHAPIVIAYKIIHRTLSLWLAAGPEYILPQKYWLHERNMIIISISKAHACIRLASPRHTQHAIISFWPNGCALFVQNAVKCKPSAHNRTLHINSCIARAHGWRSPVYFITWHDGQ